MSYLIFGINDDGKIIGTTFDPLQKIKNQNLKNQITEYINPKINFEIHEITAQDKSIVIFKIPKTTTYPVKFNGLAYIRIGDATRPLNQHQEKEGDLWEKLRGFNFEKSIDLADQTKNEIYTKLNCNAYRKLSEQDINDEQILQYMARDNLIKKIDENNYSITKLGALLLANNIQDFSHDLINKIPRLILYQDNIRTSRQREFTLLEGYATLIPKIIDEIENMLPLNEEIQKALRKKLFSIPSAL